MANSEAPFVPVPTKRTKVPRSKEDVLNAIGLAGVNAEMKRVKNHVAEIYFPDTQATFLLAVHKPRGPRGGMATKKEAAAGRAKDKAGTARGRRRQARH